MAFEAGGNSALGLPGQGGGAFPQEENLLTAGASGTLPNEQATQQRVQQIIQQLIQSRMGGSSGVAFGPQTLQQPRLPQPPTPAGGGPGIPQGSFQSSGERKRADKQALFGTISNLVNKAEQRHYEMKVNKIKADFETLSNAIQGYNEAKAAGNNEAMGHNAKLINSILSDPKKSKELLKAYDVDPNPLAQKKKEKPNPANDALKQVYSKDLQDFQQGRTQLAPQAQALMRKMPERAGIDPRIMIMEQLTKSGVIPKAGEELTFTKDLLEIQKSIQNNQTTNATKDKLAHLMANTMLQRTNKMAKTALTKTLMTVKGANDRQEIVLKAYQYRADKQLEGVNNRVAELKDRFSSKTATASDKKFSEFINSLDKKGKLLNDQLQAAVKAHNTDEAKRVNKEIDGLVMMQSIANAEAARRTGLNPQDFNSDATQLSPEEMQFFNGLFQGNEEDGASANQQ
jgi:hypothetical protein